VRDHYTSFAYTMSFGGGDADIQAVKVSGSGRGTLPDFSDTDAFPVTELMLFLPGITSYEFLTGANADLEYIDPATGDAVDQTHAGASFLAQGLTCRDCHTAASSETFDPPNAGGFFSGAMETLVLQRGGVNTIANVSAPPDGQSRSFSSQNAPLTLQSGERHLLGDCRGRLKRTAIPETHAT